MGERERRRTAAAAVLVLLASVLATGCGSDLVQAADAGSAATDPPTATKPVRPMGVDETGRDPREAEMMAADRKYVEWLRSDYVKKLNPRPLKPLEGMGHYGYGARTFEEAVDEADLAVSGEVEDLFFIPEGTITEFRVDRTAKGSSPRSIYVLQTTFVAPDEHGNAELVADRSLSMLFEGDRAVLILKRYPSTELMGHQLQFVGDRFEGDPIYRVEGVQGQYRSAGGTVRVEKPEAGLQEPDLRFDGKSESDVLEAVEARVRSDKSHDVGDPR